jgi:esterase/lipase
MRGVSAPVLILNEESDVQIPLSEAHAVFDDIASPDKTLKTYLRDTPGCIHCQLDAIGTVQPDISD